MILAVLGVLLAACSGPPPATHPEVLDQVEFPFDRAVRKALDEVPDSKLLSMELRQAQGPDPVWHTAVATTDGTVHVVRTDAVLGRLLDTAVTAAQSPSESEETAKLVDEAELLPEEAAEKAARTAVTDPHYGKVTDVRLTENPEGKVVWLVTVAAIAPQNKRVHVVDAVSGEVLDTRTDEISPPPMVSATPST